MKIMWNIITVIISIGDGMDFTMGISTPEYLTHQKGVLAMIFQFLPVFL